MCVITTFRQSRKSTCNSRKYLAGQFRSRRPSADRRRVWSLPEAAALAGLSAGVFALRLLRFQSAVHGRHSAALVQSAGFGELGRRSQKATRYTLDSGAVVNGIESLVDDTAPVHDRHAPAMHLPIIHRRCIVSYSPLLLLHPRLRHAVLLTQCQMWLVVIFYSYSS